MSQGAPCQILLNNKAGKLHPRAGADQILQMAEQIDLQAEVHIMPSADAMRPFVRRLVEAGADRIGIAGGDGTVALAVQELAHMDTALGILPQGTFNNFATALRLPMDLPAALRVLKEGVVREVSLGKVESIGKPNQAEPSIRHYFTEAAGVGLFADALALYGAGGGKNMLRGMAVLTRLVLSLKAHRVRLVLDGKAEPEQPMVLCAVANTYRMSYGVAVAPGAKLTDEVLDVVTVGDLAVGELMPYFRAMRSQTHQNLPKVRTLQAREVRIETRRSQNIHCDDQVVGTTPTTLTLQPRALKVLVPEL
ncbi:MAG: diacylglycerol kinase family protein [Armatimonadota bacterium]